MEINYQSLPLHKQSEHIFSRQSKARKDPPRGIQGRVSREATAGRAAGSAGPQRSMCCNLACAHSDQG